MATYKLDGDLEVTGSISFTPSLAVPNNIMHGYMQPAPLIKCSKTKSQCSVDTLVSDGYIPALPTTYGSVVYYIMFEGDSKVYEIIIQYVGSYVTYLYWGGGNTTKGCIQLYTGNASYSYSTSTTFNNYTAVTLSQSYYTITLADPPAYNTNYIPIINRGASAQTAYSNVYKDSAYLEIPSTAGKVLQTTGDGTAAWGDPASTHWTIVEVTTSNYTSYFEMDDGYLSLDCQPGYKYKLSTGFLNAVINGTISCDYLLLTAGNTDQLWGGTIRFAAGFNPTSILGSADSCSMNLATASPSITLNPGDVSVIKSTLGSSTVVYFDNGDLVFDVEYDS